MEDNPLYSQMVRAAKRDNNKLRSYLIVNPVLCKHIPAAPVNFFAKSKELAEKLKSIILDEPVLVTAFAETATALGAAVCSNLNKDSYFITTTRENYNNEECVYFSEVHSHAAAQKLYIKGLEKVLDKVNHIVFVEDEITTGNTIINIINALKERFSIINSKKIWVLSFINGMISSMEERFSENNITPLYLLKTDNEAISEKIKNLNLSGLYYNCNNQETEFFKLFNISKYINPRFAVKFSDYAKCLDNMINEIEKNIKEISDDILILGTEECMYPGLFFAKSLIKDKRHVTFHATTRSPILTDSNKEYPLQARFSLESFYEEERVTYVYNLRKYSQIIIISDSIKNKKGVYSLVNALRQHGDDNINIFVLGEN